MNVLRSNIDRKEVIDFYLQTDNVKKGTTTPFDYGLLDWNDPNALDTWLHKHGYKYGIMPGFKKWAYVQLSKNDLLDTAIASHIFPALPQRLAGLLNTKEFQQWTPNKIPLPVWYQPLSRGEILKDFAIILRPAVTAECSRFYVEDGSGRSICYLRAIHNLDSVSEMYGFIGCEPDSSSNFMQKNFPELLTRRLNPEDFN